MILITSASYINHGLRAEFGELPPAMLPVQNRRLYEHQLRLVQGGGDVVLSLPQSYLLDEWDSARLKELKVKTVRVPDGFSLGQSVVYVLNVVGRYDEPLHLLHGDTLFDHVDFDMDFCVVAEAQDDYSYADSNEKTGTVFAGYFSFSSQSLLIRKITECGYDFIAGVRGYGKECPMREVRDDSWLDFGLINAYYRSVSKLTTQRAFNSLEATPYAIVKRSRDTQKILAEAHWFQSLPYRLRHYAPTVWNSGTTGEEAFYEIEYYYLSSLSNLYVFGRNPLFVWNEIIDSVREYLSDEAREVPSSDQRTQLARRNNALYGAKSGQRLRRYAEVTKLDLCHPWIINGVETPSLETIVEEMDAAIAQDATRFVTLMHGDLCFSNILYDFKSKSIRVIDPRGLDAEGTPSLYGDLRYDVAKMAHSVLGMYDFIIGGLFSLEEVADYEVRLSFGVDGHIEEIQRLFRSKTFAGYTLDELSVYPIMVHLFLSMLPLHQDNPRRQKAMLANALRLYVDHKNKKIC